MKTARQLLSEKNITQAITIAPDCTVFQAIQVLAEWNIGAILVTESDKMVGIFSERDYTRKVTLTGKSTATTLVSEVMTRGVLCVKPDTQVSECLALMTEKRIRHLPVKEANVILGVLSIGDLVRAAIADQQFTIAQLESYIYQ